MAAKDSLVVGDLRWKMPPRGAGQVFSAASSVSVPVSRVAGVVDATDPIAAEIGAVHLDSQGRPGSSQAVGTEHRRTGGGVGAHLGRSASRRFRGGRVPVVPYADSRWAAARRERIAGQLAGGDDSGGAAADRIALLMFLLRCSGSATSTTMRW